MTASSPRWSSCTDALTNSRRKSGSTIEDANYTLDGSTSDSRLRSLMEERGLRQRDLLEVFGSRGIASEVVSGKRAISKAQARKLAEPFHVPADLFL